MLDGWVQIVRGPRPKAGSSKRNQSAVSTKGAVATPKTEVNGVPPLQQASRPPDAVAAKASAEVQRLEAAISALGENNPHAFPLQEALRVA